MKNHRNKILALFAITLIISACEHKSIIDPTQSEVSFKNDVQLVLSGNCQSSGCHDATNFSEFPLMTYDDLTNNGLVESGHADRSKIYKALIGEGGDNMPPSGPLPDAQIKVIHDWIEQGAKNN